VQLIGHRLYSVAGFARKVPLIEESYIDSSNKTITTYTRQERELAIDICIYLSIVGQFVTPSSVSFHKRKDI
jgi:hypothetical protein